MAPAPLLQLNNVSFGFGHDMLFEDFSAAIGLGERICLVGRNGSGKSSLLKIAAGLVLPTEGEVFTQPGARISYLPQDPDFSGYKTLGDYARADLDEYEHYLADAAMDGLGVDPEVEPESASGGERRRAALARVLNGKPDVLLLDEPTNHLDIHAITWLENHLKSLRAGFVLISHDRAFLTNLSKITLWVDRGQLRRNPKGFSAFEEWQDTLFAEEDMQRHKLDRLLKAEGKWAVEGISARRKRNQGRLRKLQDMRKDRKEQILRPQAAAMALESGQVSGRLVAEAIKVNIAFDNRPIVTDFSTKILRGDRVGFVGPNGAGKTTLLKMLTGEIKPDSGKIRLGTNLVPAYFDQARDKLDPERTLWESLTEDKLLGISGGNDQIMVRGKPKHVVGYLKEFLFDESQARAPIKALSGGEKARLMLAKLMARESNLLILDEPTNDLDIETLDLLQEMLADYDGTLLLVSHDRDFLDRSVSTVIGMEGDGHVVEFAGGWSDYNNHMTGLKPTTEKSGSNKKKKATQIKEDKPTSKLSFKQQFRLDSIPAEIDKISSEIKKLNRLLADPELYTKDPKKFNLATKVLGERETSLEELEEEWLELESLKDEA